MIAKLGQDGHDRGAKVIATAFADLGFDVDMGPLFQTPEECARAGDRERRARGGREHPGRRPQDAGARDHRGAAPRRARDDIIVFVGGVIPQQDYGFLYDAGVKGIYGPGTPIPVSAKDVLEQIRAQLARA
jgi:methylmalonyl-CoA mutase